MPSSRTSAGLASRLLASAGLLYPILVWLGLKYLGALAIVVCFAVIVALRLALGRRNALDLVLAFAVSVAVALLAVDARTAVLIHPVLVDFGFAAVFAYTLAAPPTMVERLARILEPDLPSVAVPYLRKVTMAWVAFFLCNGAVAVWTVVWGTLDQWALYNGFVAYLLIGVMFAAELLVRRRVRPKEGGPA
jgi:uncharacterized membrane protein